MFPRRLFEYDADAEAEVVSCAPSLVEYDRIVIGLERPDIDLVADLDIEPAAEHSCETGGGLIDDLRTVDQRRRRARQVVDVRAAVADTRHRMDERLKGLFGRVVLDLDAADKVVKRIVGIERHGLRRRAGRHRERKTRGVVRARKVSLKADVTAEIINRRGVKAMEGRAVSDSGVCRRKPFKAGVDLAVRVSDKNLSLVMIGAVLCHRTNACRDHERECSYELFHCYLLLS